MAQVLQTSEVVTSSGFGALLVPFSRGPWKGKVYVTTLRLAVVPDDPRLTPIWSTLWSDLTQVRIKKGLLGATAFVTVGEAAEIGVDSTKAIVGDVHRAWLHLRAVAPQLEWGRVAFLPTVETRCAACSAQVPPGERRCGMCLRLLSWPPPLDSLAAPEVLPESFPDGTPTQRDAVAHGLAVYVTAAICTGDQEFVATASRLVAAIVGREPANPQSFGPLPRLRGLTGEQSDNEKFWQMVCRYPQRLAGGG